MSSNKSFSTETADRYARAIFELAQENSELDSVEKNFKDLLLVYNSNKELENFVRNPTKSFENQLKAMNKIAELMKFSKLLKDFLSVLVIKRRIFFLKKIITSFLKLSAEKRGELTAQLVSSKNLTSQELKNVSDELSKIVGFEINFDYKVDQDLIGGFKMQVGSLMIDTSIKSKLNKYKQIMLEN